MHIGSYLFSEEDWLQIISIILTNNESADHLFLSQDQSLCQGAKSLHLRFRFSKLFNGSDNLVFSRLFQIKKIKNKNQIDNIIKSTSKESPDCSLWKKNHHTAVSSEKLYLTNMTKEIDT